MNSPHTLLSEIEAFSALNGTTPESVCRRATGNPRKWDRMKAKIEQWDSDARRIRAYMASQAPASDEATA